MMKRLLTVVLLLSMVLAGCQAAKPSGTDSPATAHSKVETTAKQTGTQSVAPAAQEKRGHTETAKVIEAIDGDTVKVRLRGRVVTIRMLLVDTPETHHPTKGVQPYGPEAAAFTKKLLEGKTVEVEPAVDNGHDKYGRLLAYLFIKGKSVEELLLKNGYARVAYVYPPNTKYLSSYRKAEAEAKDKKLRIWKTPGYVQADGYHPEVIKDKANSAGASSSTGALKTDDSSIGFAPDKNGNCQGHIKGNINSHGARIYHVPSDRSYKVTKAERCFMTEKEAVKAGFRKPYD